MNPDRDTLMLNVKEASCGCCMSICFSFASEGSEGEENQILKLPKGLFVTDTFQRHMPELAKLLGASIAEAISRENGVLFVAETDAMRLYKPEDRVSREQALAELEAGDPNVTKQ